MTDNIIIDKKIYNEVIDFLHINLVNHNSFVSAEDIAKMRDELISMIVNNIDGVSLVNNEFSYQLNIANSLIDQIDLLITDLNTNYENDIDTIKDNLTNLKTSLETLVHINDNNTQLLPDLNNKLIDITNRYNNLILDDNIISTTIRINGDNSLFYPVWFLFRNHLIEDLKIYRTKDMYTSYLSNDLICYLHIKGAGNVLENKYIYKDFRIIKFIETGNNIRLISSDLFTFTKNQSPITTGRFDYPNGSGFYLRGDTDYVIEGNKNLIEETIASISDYEILNGFEKTINGKYYYTEAISEDIINTIEINKINYFKEDPFETNPFIEKPVILHPNSDVVDVNDITPIFQASSFSVLDGSDNFIRQEWEVYTSTNVLITSFNSTNQDSINYDNISNNPLASPGSNIKVRMRYIGENLGSSEWSDYKSARLANFNINTPILTYNPNYVNNISLQPNETYTIYLDSIFQSSLVETDFTGYNYKLMSDSGELPNNLITVVSFNDRYFKFKIPTLVSGINNFRIRLQYKGRCHGINNTGDYSADTYQKFFIGIDKANRYPKLIDGGYFHTVGLKEDGTVLSLGSNDNGQCNVSTWTDIIQVAGGGYYTVGVKSDGTCVATGSNSNGQRNVSSWTNIKQVACGYSHTVGLKSNGTCVGVGLNDHGTCDVDSWTTIKQVACGDYHTVGVKANGTCIFTGYNYYDICEEEVSSWTNIKQVACGGFHTVGLKEDGTVIAVGSNHSGECNVSSWNNIIQVACGYNHTIGLKEDGTCVVTGSNSSGQCDVSFWTDIIQVACGGFHTVGLKEDGTVIAVGSNSYGQCNVGSWTNIKQIAGGFHTVGLKEDRTCVAIGNNDYDQCNVSSWTNIKQIICGYYHTVGLKEDGTVLSLGSNDNGQCNVSSWTDIIQVACGGYHTIGLKSNGTCVATGVNVHGQCNVSSWTNIVQVACGRYHTVGLKSDGTCVAIGDNVHGQCYVSSWNNIVQVACGYEYTIGLKSDGTCVVIGRNDDGQRNVDGWTNIEQVACGGYHTVGLQSNGTCVATGDNNHGQCNVFSWTDIISVSAGYSHTVGLKSDGTCVATGWNGYGQCNVDGWDLF